ncbi:MAG: methyltransferase domain-containing protein [Candidatus Hodarchaeota archaeon]
MKEISKLKDISSILEIGPGNKIIYDILSKMGYDVKTMDINSQTNPDIIADIRDPGGFINESFDLILCCQVLEHLPYSDFHNTLENLYRMTKKYLIITLPYTSYGTFKPYFKIHFFPFLKPISWIRIFNLFPQEHIFNGKHYWEIGKKGFKLKRILKDIKDSGFMIRKHYTIFENPYHYMFACEKKKLN